MNTKQQVKLLLDTGNIPGLRHVLGEREFWNNSAADVVCIAGMLADRGFLNEALELTTRSKEHGGQFTGDAADTLELIKADCWIQSGRFREAVESYQAILSHKNDPIAHINKALAHWELRDYSKALHHYELGLKESPENTIALRGIGEVLNELERYKEAVPFLRRAVQLDPNYGKAYTALGVACYNTGDWLEAYRALKRSLELNPEDGRAKLGLSKIETIFGLSSDTSDTK